MKYTLRKNIERELSWMYERRLYLMKLIEQGVDIDSAVRKEIRDKFGISYSALTQDIIYLTVDKLERGSVFVTEKMRKHILQRDKEICQYCGILCEYPIVEHVIPASSGGIAKPYNLVAACILCNNRKRTKTWIPANIDEITKDYPSWKSRILELAVERKST